MNKKNDNRNKVTDQEVQFEEMEKAEEFSITDFVTGLGVGIAIGSAIVVLT